MLYASNAKSFLWPRFLRLVLNGSNSKRGSGSLELESHHYVIGNKLRQNIYKWLKPSPNWRKIFGVQTRSNNVFADQTCRCFAEWTNSIKLVWTLSKRQYQTCLNIVQTNNMFYKSVIQSFIFYHLKYLCTINRDKSKFPNGKNVWEDFWWPNISHLNRAF